MKAVCPKNPDHKKFIVTAHVTQEWEVDETGDFLKCTNECESVMHSPDEHDIWGCSECGADAIVTN